MAPRKRPAAACFGEADGKILLAGYYVAGYDFGFVVVRYNADGSLDTTFGASGIATHMFSGAWGDGASAIVVQSNGDIVLGGRGTDSSDVHYFALARFTPDGTLDATFGTGGVTLTAINGNPGNNGINALALLPGDGLLAGGAADDFALARYDADRHLITTFGSGGIQMTNLGSSHDWINSIAHHFSNAPNAGLAEW